MAAGWSPAAIYARWHREGASRFIADAAPVAALSIVYIATARLGLSLAAVDGVASPVWPPSGISLAAVLLFGYRLWPGIACGAIAVNVWAGMPFLAALGVGAGNTVEALLGAFLLRQCAGFDDRLERLRDVIALMFCAAGLSSMIGATIGTAFAWSGGALSADHYGTAWVTWWIGDAVGDLVVAPVLLTWSALPRAAAQPRRYGEFCAVLSAMLVCTWLGFTRLHRPSAFVMFPFLLWVALRIGQRGATATVLAACALAIAATHAGLGPFAGADPSYDLAWLQVFMCVFSVTGLVLSAVLSERRRAEQTLRANEERFQALIEKGADGIILLDAMGVLLYASASTGAIHGYRPRIGFPAAEEVMHADEFERMSGLWAQLRRQPGGTLTAQFRIASPNAVARWAEGRWTNLLDDSRVRAIVVNYRDITDRKTAEEALHEAREHLDIATESMSAAVTRCSRDLRYLWVSAAYAEWIGLRAEDVAGHPIAEILGEEAMATIHPHIERVLAGERVEYEAEVTFRSLGVRWINAVYTPTHDADGIVDGWVAAIVDLTRQKGLERELRLAHDHLERRVAERTAELHAAHAHMADLSRRLMVMQDDERREVARHLHESSLQDLAGAQINLTQVQQSAHLLCERAQAELRDGIALIDASMRDLRALSYALHPPLLDEIGLASAAHWFADGFAKRSGIAAEVEVARDLGRLPPAVEQTLFRILEKCLNNIERHSGSATARVQLLSANGAVTLRVQDAGRGIAPATLRSIERGEATLGIGMLRIRERLHQVGGRLRVDSGDHGTTIEATIPVAPAAGAAPTVSHPGIAASSPPH